jgi:hypothetical protein
MQVVRRFTFSSLPTNINTATLTAAVSRLTFMRGELGRHRTKFGACDAHKSGSHWSGSHRSGSHRSGSHWSAQQSHRRSCPPTTENTTLLWSINISLQNTSHEASSERKVGATPRNVETHKRKTQKHDRNEMGVHTNKKWQHLAAFETVTMCTSLPGWVQTAPL